MRILESLDLKRTLFVLIISTLIALWISPITSKGGPEMGWSILAFAIIEIGVVAIMMIFLGFTFWALDQKRELRTVTEKALHALKKKLPEIVKDWDKVKKLYAVEEKLKSIKALGNDWYELRATLKNRQYPWLKTTIIFHLKSRTLHFHTSEEYVVEEDKELKTKVMKQVSF